MITPVTEDQFSVWLSMALKLWPDYEEADLADELKAILINPKQYSYLYVKEGHPIAFATISLRADYVQGSKSSPTGYVEAVFVEGEHRQQGIAKEMIIHGEQWAQEQGCLYFGSDCLLANSSSEYFHKSIGFAEVNRTINFVKKIGRNAYQGFEG